MGMNRFAWSVVGLGAVLVGGIARAQTTPSPAEIVQKVLDSDPWGLAGAEVTAHITLLDKNGSQSELAFSARSLRHDPPLSKSLVRFTQPAEMAGAGYLQIQRKDGEDERYLYLPELKRSRRIAGSLRSGGFMGTDFSFGDLDRRDLRDAAVESRGEETVGRFPCWHLDVAPRGADAQYSHIELWVRKDNFLPLKSLMYDKNKTLLKTLSAEEVRRVSGHWFITRSSMVNHRDKHTTKLVLEKIEPRSDFPGDDFTLRALEKS